MIVYDTRKKFFEQLYRQEAALDPLHVTGVHYSRKNVIWMLSGQRVLRYTPADRIFIILLLTDWNRPIDIQPDRKSLTGQKGELF